MEVGFGLLRRVLNCAASFSTRLALETGRAFFLSGIIQMDKSKLAVDPLPPIDKLMSRPDAAPLPTTLDPGGPEAHGYPADPKPVAKEGKGDPEATDPAPGDLGRSA